MKTSPTILLFVVIAASVQILASADVAATDADPNKYPWPVCYDIVRNCDGLNFSALGQYTMQRKILQDASFKNSNWSNIVFHVSKAMNSDFTGANMVGASGRYVNFHKAILKNVDFSKANIERAQLQGADLTGAVFDDDTYLKTAEFDVETIFPDGLDWKTTSFFPTDFRGMKLKMDRKNITQQDFSVSVNPRFKNLQKFSFHANNAHGAKFVGCNMTGSWMQAWKAEGIDFTGADLTNVYSQYSSMKNAILTNTILTNAKLEKANLYRCDLTGADMRGVYLKQTNLYECKYDSNTKFDADFDPSDWGMVPVTGEWPKQWPGCYDSGKNCDGVNFNIVPYGNLVRQTMTDGSFVGSNWQELFSGASKFTNSDLTKANFKAAAAYHVGFNNATLHDVDLSFADVSYSDFQSADLTGATCNEKTKFKKAMFDINTIFPDGKDFRNTDFFTNGLKGMRLLLIRQNITGQDFSAAVKPQFRDYTGGDFWGVIANGAKFRGSILKGVRFGAMKANDIDFTCADLTSTKLDYTSMKRGLFAGANLKKANLRGSNLEDCVLLGADLSTTYIDSRVNFCGCTYDQFTKFPGGFEPPTCMQYTESASNYIANCVALGAEEPKEEPTCLGLNLAVNGDAETGWRTPYGNQGLYVDVEAQSDDVYEGDYAFRFRAYGWHTGMSKVVNYPHPHGMREADCICAGTTIKFEAKVKLQKKTENGWEGVGCDPKARTRGRNWNTNSSGCPMLSPHVRVPQGYKGEDLYGVDSWDPDGWNTFEAEWTVPDEWFPISTWLLAWRPNRYSPLYNEDDDDIYMLVDNMKYYVVSSTECPENGGEALGQSANKNLFDGPICSAEAYGDPHITTFDGLKYDAHVPGEVILLQNSSDTHPTEIHGRFETIRDGWSATVVTGVAMRGNDIDLPVVQISMDSEADSVDNIKSFRGDSCPVQLFVGGELLNVTAPKIDTGSDDVSVTVKKSTITIQYPELLVDLTVGKFNKCLFWVDVHLLNCRHSDPISGLLGSPNNNKEDDWEGRDGTVFDLPTNERDLIFKPAFDYVRDNWVIFNEEESLFEYTPGTSFEAFTPDEEALEYDSTVEKLIEEAGEDLDDCDGEIGCLVEAVTLGKEAADEFKKNPEFGLTAAEEFQAQRETKEIEEEALTVTTSSFRSGSKGDPHFKTWKQEHFEYHGQCDMMLTKDDGFADGLGLEVQIRTKLIRFWSYIKSAAIRIGDDILEVQGNGDLKELENLYWVNFEYQGELKSLGGFPVKLVERTNYRRQFEIDLGSKYPGQKIVIAYFREFVSVDFINGTEESFGNTVGLLGDFNTGKTLARDGVSALDDFYEFGSEWQVLPFEVMLFHDVEAPQFPQKCILPEDPQGERRRRLTENTVTEDQADAACAHLTDASDRKDCVYDILATQDIGMVGAY